MSPRVTRQPNVYVVEKAVAKKGSRAGRVGWMKGDDLWQSFCRGIRRVCHRPQPRCMIPTSSVEVMGTNSIHRQVTTHFGRTDDAMERTLPPTRTEPARLLPPLVTLKKIQRLETASDEVRPARRDGLRGLRRRGSGAVIAGVVVSMCSAQRTWRDLMVAHYAVANRTRCQHSSKQSSQGGRLDYVD